MKIDLHSHSTCSDGTYRPSELVHLAKQAGIELFALTDHDTVSGVEEARQTASQLGIKLINGVEISCTHEITGGYGKHQSCQKVIHVVALDCHDMTTLQQRLTLLQDSREQRGFAIIEKLSSLLNPDDPKTLQQALWHHTLTKTHQNPKSIGRAHIAQVLFELGFVKKIQEAFDKYLADDKPAYVPITTISMHQTIELIHECGGLAVLAHPTRYGLSATRIRRLIGDFAQMAGDGCELPAVNEPISTRAMIDREIIKHHLLASVGSDFHGDNMVWRKLGQVPTLQPNQTGVWEHFRH